MQTGLDNCNVKSLLLIFKILAFTVFVDICKFTFSFNSGFHSLVSSKLI